VETLFTADQHVEYDPIREMYLWVRQGEQVSIGGGLSNIDRLAVSRDLDRWVALDLISVDILNQAGIIEGSFDYLNSIKNMAVCDQDQYSEAWWCKANTSSRIRSAWISDNSINFQWNAVASHDGGVSWVPYIDSATFHVDDNSMRYERKYHLADPNNPWMFGAVSPNKDGDLGVGALYVDTETADSLERPYINFAFGVL
jgi:hypothetical protein